MTLGRISFGPLFHQTLGFENFLRDVEKMLGEEVKPSTFPHHNIIKVDDSRYIVELAVAGFSKDNINVSVDNGSLIIKGEITDVTDAEIVHKGIATRKFTRTFALGEYMEVTGAEIKDGMLHIDIDRIVPEEKKPKEIAIKVAKK